MKLDDWPEIQRHPRMYEKLQKLRGVRARRKFWQSIVITGLLGIIFYSGVAEVINGDLRGILSMLSLPAILLFWKFIE